LSKRPVANKNFDLIFYFIPNPNELILNSHQLTNIQLNKLSKEFSSLQILRMSFMPNCDKDFLSEALKNFPNLHTLELNSCNLDDETLK
jgi:hypothetical protein